jgi:light-regulated signal transduction histidine kinase (bacteriophytochrome)
MQNLLENAVKYTSRKAEVEIEFGRTVLSGEEVFFVRDNGAGFDISFADKLFEPFCRLHTEDEFEGSGMGLPAVQRIIERHGGRIWAEAKEGRGATFYFTLGD